jgi:hypothetical protein
MSATDWVSWHDDYDRGDTALARRLTVVKHDIDSWLDETAPRPVRVLSACAGDSRDLLQVLEGRDDAARVTGRLVEQDAENAARAAAEIERLDLTGIDVSRADAGVSDAYRGAEPADLVLMCGVFGNISDSDVQRVVRHLPQLCRRDALVVWTRSRRHPDLTIRIRSWLGEAGFDERAFVAPEDGVWSVGAHVYRGEPAPLLPGRTWFRFVR